MSNRTAIELPAPVVRLAEIFCGCGIPAAAWQTVRKYLYDFSLLDDDWDKRTLKIETGEQHIVAYLLDHLKLTEHGSGIGGCWLTDDGKEVLAFLDKWGANWEEDKSVKFVDESGIRLKAFASTSRSGSQSRLARGRKLVLHTFAATAGWIASAKSKP